MRIDRKLVLSALLAVAGVGAGCAPTPTPDDQLPVTLTPTETPPPTPTPTPTILPTLIPTATSTPVSMEANLLDYFLSRDPEADKSDYPAWLNYLGVEINGVNSTNIDRFKEYFLQREIKVKPDDNQIQKLDRMFGQLSLPVVDLADRSLNFDWENGGQGLGFTHKDFDALRTFEDMRAIQKSSEGVFSPISVEGEDGRNRAWTLSLARDFEKTVLAYVDEYLRLNGIDNPSTNATVQSERRSLFEEIVYGDFGVQESDRDLLWWTVNDDFIVCETHSADADKRSNQPEALREVHFDPDLETGLTSEEEDTTSEHDSDNPVLVVMVTDGTILRVEAYDLSDPQDPLIDPDTEGYFASGDTRSHGGRWLPCGEGIKIPGVPEEQPGKPQVKEKGPNPDNPWDDRGSGETENPGTGINEH